MTDAMDKAVVLLQGASRVAVFTGAGMSADAGISTFRKDPNSLWSGVLGGTTLAYFGTTWGWKCTPGLAWRKYCEVFLAPILDARPHPGHHALVRLEEARFSPLPVITMNVDGLHQRAGHLPENVAELRRGIRVIELNLHSSPISSVVDVFLQGKAQDLVPALVERVVGGKDR